MRGTFDIYIIISGTYLRRAFLASCLLLSQETVLAEQIVFNPHSRGVELAEVSLRKGIFTSELTCLRFGKSGWKMGVATSKPPAAAAEIAQSEKAFAVINANFFGQDLEPLGLIVRKSTTIHQVQKGGRTLTGLLVQTRTGIRILHRDTYTQSPDIEEAIQAGPRLIAEGQAIRIPVDSSTRRSAVGIDRLGRLILCASKDRFPGLTLQELQSLLLSPEFNLQDALNLDGGGSSQLSVQATEERPAIEVFGGDRVPVFIVMKRLIGNVE
jgi:uncharacterized protein YigE (DUF2233 family)